MNKTFYKLATFCGDCETVALYFSSLEQAKHFESLFKSMDIDNDDVILARVDVDDCLNLDTHVAFSGWVYVEMNVDQDRSVTIHGVSKATELSPVYLFETRSYYYMQYAAPRLRIAGWFPSKEDAVTHGEEMHAILQTKWGDETLLRETKKTLPKVPLMRV